MAVCELLEQVVCEAQKWKFDIDLNEHRQKQLSTLQEQLSKQKADSLLTQE